MCGQIVSPLAQLKGHNFMHSYASYRWILDGPSVNFDIDMRVDAQTFSNDALVPIKRLITREGLAIFGKTRQVTRATVT